MHEVATLYERQLRDPDNALVAWTQALLSDPRDTDAQKNKYRANNSPQLGIGDRSYIEGAIIDKNCKIGSDVRIINSRGVETSDETPELYAASHSESPGSVSSPASQNIPKSSCQWT